LPDDAVILRILGWGKYQFHFSFSLAALGRLKNLRDLLARNRSPIARLGSGTFTDAFESGTFTDALGGQNLYVLSIGPDRAALGSECSPAG
jgi:hypothetical protein